MPYVCTVNVSCLCRPCSVHSTAIPARHSSLPGLLIQFLPFCRAVMYHSARVTQQLAARGGALHTPRRLLQEFAGSACFRSLMSTTQNLQHVSAVQCGAGNPRNARSPPPPVPEAVQAVQQDIDPLPLKKRAVALYIGYMGTNYRGNLML